MKVFLPIMSLGYLPNLSIALDQKSSQISPQKKLFSKFAEDSQWCAKAQFIDHQRIVTLGYEVVIMLE